MAHFLDDKIIQARFYQQRDSNNRIIFKDPQIEVTAQLTWSSNIQISNVEISVTNTALSSTYNSIDLTRSFDLQTQKHYIVMHLCTNKRQDNTHAIDLSNDLIDLGVDDYFFCLFKIYETECPPLNELNSELNQDDPDEKDGSILIGTR